MEKKAPDQRQQETVHYEAPPPYEPLMGVVATAPMVAPPAPPTLFGVGESKCLFRTVLTTRPYKDGFLRTYTSKT